MAIITDQETMDIAKELDKAALKSGAKSEIFLIENYTSRPAKDLPKDLKKHIKDFKPTVSIYAATGLTGELPVFRAPLIDHLYNGLKCRHAHMINITKELMADGMNKDYELVYKVTNRLKKLFDKTEQLIATDPHGTNITLDLDTKNLRWIPSHGKIRAGKPWQNLPSGEIFTTPANANGTFVAWVLGDFLSEKYGELKSPIEVVITDGYITKVSAKNPKDKRTASAVKDFQKYVKQYKFGDRIGELGIGTLIGLDHFVGNLLQDEKFPGIHMAFGHPYPQETGAKWDCPSHIDIIAKNVTLKVVAKGKEKIIMKNGQYITEILG